ncbi:MAG TPA: TldD/PmbA family protein [Aestuariivirga sp.]|nr:TldD/PmbA family protein [Aestuariivirga sp.]
MTDGSLNQLAVDVVARAMGCGGDGADAMAIDRQDVTLHLRHGAVEKLERAEAREVGVRVFVGQSSATVCGSTLDGAALTRLAERAVAMARRAPADPLAGLAGPDLLAHSIPDLDLAAATLPGEADLKAMALAAEAAALAVDGVTQCEGASASTSRRQVALATSQGFAGGYGRTTTGFSISAIAGTGTGMERDYGHSSACHVEDLRDPVTVGTEAGTRAVKRLSPRKLASQAVPVIFDRRVASSLLMHLAAAINGQTVANGASFLKNDRGKALFRPGITISDDPLRRRGLASRPFDGEGLVTRAMDLVADGVLTDFVLDLHSARQLGLPPTGHGARGLASPPSPSVTNLTLARGTTPLADMMAGVARGLLVMELIGSGANVVNGDYSRGASGFWIENGIAVYPVSEVTIAGNLRDMFRQLTPADDLEFRGSVNAPSVLVEGLTLAGR